MSDSFLKLLKPQNVFLTKKRIGPQEDGGYVMVDYVLENCDALFTYGVGGDVRFENDFCEQYNKPAYLFDHTPSAGSEEPWVKGLLNFTPEGLGFDEKCKQITEHCAERNISSGILLKIDIEGYELDYFTDNRVPSIGSSVMGLIIEVHWIQDETNREKFIKMLNTLDENFILFHIHGNVWGGEWDYNSLTIPRVLELSFVNRNLVTKYEPDNQDYPIEGLDFTNRGGSTDCDLSFLKTV